jgi:hypothetical protein
LHVEWYGASLPYRVARPRGRWARSEYAPRSRENRAYLARVCRLTMTPPGRCRDA